MGGKSAAAPRAVSILVSSLPEMSLRACAVSSPSFVLRNLDSGTSAAGIASTAAVIEKVDARPESSGADESFLEWRGGAEMQQDGRSTTGRLWRQEAAAEERVGSGRWASSGPPSCEAGGVRGFPAPPPPRSGGSGMGIALPYLETKIPRKQYSKIVDLEELERCVLSSTLHSRRHNYLQEAAEISEEHKLKVSQVSPLNRLSVQVLPWTRHQAWIRGVLPNFQAQTLKYLSTSTSRSHPAFPFSLGTNSLEQDKLDPYALVADELAHLGQRLREMVAAEVPKLAEAAEYFFKRGVEGKRFRPMVLLLMASALTVEDSVQEPAPGKQRERQQQVAEITEMIHVASLLHDDVLDHADTRRGIGSLNSIVGNKLAVLAGDFLLARASVALASLHNNEVVELLSKSLEHLVTGEIMQLTTETQEICSMDYYMQKTFYKTASLMANSCKSVALLSEHPREVADLAFEFGRHLGLAFQLVDDSLDFVGTKASLGKPTLADLTQGIATAPVLFALEEHPTIYNLVNRKFRKSGDVDQALDLVRNSKGILRTQQLAVHHAQQAALAIASLPPSSSERTLLCRRALAELTEQVITRTK